MALTPRRRKAARRRPGWFPGRRWASTGLLASAAALVLAAPAAGQTVVSATVFGGGPDGGTPQAVSAQTLAGCPLYSGSNPITLMPGDGSDQLPSDSSWSLATVLTCALHIPASDLTGTQVFSPQNGYERALTPADLTDPTRYHDPAAPQALPVISTDAGENLNAYARPWRGGGDDNARDHITVSDAPVSIVVWEKGAPLTVHITQRTTARSQTDFATQLGASATEAGQPIPAGSLRMDWNFADGSGSHAPAPTHTFTDGAYAVTVLVTDTTTGRGGTATAIVSTPAGAPPGAHSRSGGHRRTHSSTPTGSARGSRSAHGAGARGGSAANPAPTSHATGSAPAPASASAASPRPRGAAAGHPRAASVTRPPRPRPRPRAHHAGPRPGGQALVSGRLIGDVTVLPASASPLTRARPRPSGSTPLVRQATAGRASLGGPLAGLAVLALLGLGALREGRGLRHRRGLTTDPE